MRTTQENTVQFKPTLTAVSQCIVFIMLSTIPLGLFITTGTEIGINTLIFLAIISSLITYIGIEALFPKRLVLNDKQLTFYFGPFKYKLNPDKMTVYYEKILIIERSSKDRFGLILYRDKNKIMGISINNKFILDYEMNNTKLDIYRKEFANKLGIEINVVDSFF